MARPDIYQVSMNRQESFDYWLRSMRTSYVSVNKATLRYNIESLLMGYQGIYDALKWKFAGSFDDQVEFLTDYFNMIMNRPMVCTMTNKQANAINNSEYCLEYSNALLNNWLTEKMVEDLVEKTVQVFYEME